MPFLRVAIGKSTILKWSIALILNTDQFKLLMLNAFKIDSLCYVLTINSSQIKAEGRKSANSLMMFLSPTRPKIISTYLMKADVETN